jgi:uncharacterized protein YwlG (UPF0340 family)
MSESSRLPFVVFVPARKLLDHELAANPGFLGHAKKANSYPVFAEVKVECQERGVYVTIDPLIWSLNHKMIMLAEYGRHKRCWEAELLEAAHAGGRAAIQAFPTLDDWIDRR